MGRRPSRCGYHDIVDRNAPPRSGARDGGASRQFALVRGALRMLRSCRIPVRPAAEVADFRTTAAACRSAPCSSPSTGPGRGWDARDRSSRPTAFRHDFIDTVDRTQRAGGEPFLAGVAGTGGERSLVGRRGGTGRACRSAAVAHAGSALLVPPVAARRGPRRRPRRSSGKRVRTTSEPQRHAIVENGLADPRLFLSLPACTRSIPTISPSSTALSRSTSRALLSLSQDETVDRNGCQEGSCEHRGLQHHHGRDAFNRIQNLATHDAPQRAVTASLGVSGTALGVLAAADPVHGTGARPDDHAHNEFAYRHPADGASARSEVVV